MILVSLAGMSASLVLGLLFLSLAIHHHTLRENVCTKVAAESDERAADARERFLIGVPVAERPGFPVLSPRSWQRIEKAFSDEASSLRVQAEYHSKQRRYYERLLRTIDVRWWL